jgi:hypothetical protein
LFSENVRNALFLKMFQQFEVKNLRPYFQNGSNIADKFILLACSQTFVSEMQHFLLSG